MDSQVRVASLDRFRDFRAAYAKFGDAAQQALLTVEMEIRRMLDWLAKDQVAYWKGEIRRREEKLNEAKAALHRKRITATFGNVVQDADEIVAVRRAKEKLEAAEAKLKLVKQWYLIVEQEVQEYRPPAQQLANVLEADVPKALSSLDRMMDSIEGYLNVVPQSSEPTAVTSVVEGLDSASAAAPKVDPAKEGVTETAQDAHAATEGATEVIDDPNAETEGAA
jgi:hypothetical protein